MDRERPAPQEIYRHFKNNLYQILAVAKHSETGEELVVYQALYGTYGIYARPLEMFMGRVDHEKYPQAGQIYRFEKVALNEILNGTAGEGIIKDTAKESGNVTDVSHLPDETVKETNNIEEKHLLSEAEKEEEPNSDLLEFLDAETMDEKRRILFGMKARITDRLINDMAASLDVTVEEGDLEARYKDLMYCVETKQKFEVERRR